MSQITLPYHEVIKDYSVMNFIRKGWHIDALKLDKIHTIVTKGLPISVLDTGIDKTHVELKGKVKTQVDLTGEGFKKIHPHGTHVASIICAEKNMMGVAPDTLIGDYKVLTSDGRGDPSWVAKGLLKASEDGYTIHNLSLGSDQLSGQLKKAIQTVTKKGDIVVTAAGNDGTKIDYPAALDETIAVAALNFGPNWFAADFSSPADGYTDINVGAPGVRITAATPNNTYATWSGTSMATPIVAGIISLLLAVEPEKRANILNIIQDTAIDVGAQGVDKKTGYGLINPEGIFGLDGFTPVKPQKKCFFRDWIDKYIEKLK